MARRASSLGGLRPLAIAIAVAALLLVPAGISAQAAEEEAAPTETAPAGDPAIPAPTPDPGATAPSPAPVATPPSAPAPAASPPSNPPPTPPTAVTVSRASASASKSVSIVDFAFNPGSITVNAGDTVQWTNNGEVAEGHDVTGDGLDSGLLNSGDTYSHTFNAAGTFSYICSIHPSMEGTVTVLARSSGSSGDTGSSGDGDSSSGTESESAAVSSPDAAGSSASLPATGQRLLAPAALALMLLIVGLGLRALAPRAARRG